MKHIESSKLIALVDAVEVSSIRYSLVERMRGAFHVETVDGEDEDFTLTAMGKGTSCRCMLNVFLRTDDRYARIIIDGTVEVTPSAKIIYILGILALLVLGLFPGTINTTGQGGAMDFMVFLFLGMFVLHDANKKLEEPEQLLDRVLAAIETEFGTK